MFACRCNTPWMSASSCAAHDSTPGRVTVPLGRPRSLQYRALSSERKAEALSGRFCPSCNAQLSGMYGHVCTRHPDDPATIPTPW